MEYLIVSVYDDGYNWVVKSSQGNLDHHSSAEEKEISNVYINEIATILDNNIKKMTAEPVGNILKSAMAAFDFIMLCEDGSINIIKDSKKIFK